MTWLRRVPTSRASLRPTWHPSATAVVQCSGGGGGAEAVEQEEGWRRGGRMVDPEGSVVLGNWQAPQAQLE